MADAGTPPPVPLPLRTDAAADAATGIRPRAPTLVGRTMERQKLNAVFDQLVAGRGSVVWIDGEAGMGKTALCLAV